MKNRHKSGALKVHSSLTTYCFVAIVGSYIAWGETTPPTTNTPPQKAITQSTTVEGEEHVISEEKVSRSESIFPSNWGQAGIFRVRSAESLPEDTLSFGIGGEFYTVSNSTGTLGAASTIAESLFVGYSPIRDLTIAVARRNSSTTFGSPPLLINSLGDFYFSGIYAFNLSPVFTIGPMANILIASNFNDLVPAGTTLSAGFGGALTMSFEPLLELPIYSHLNVIYHMPQIRTSKTTTTIDPETFFNFSRYHTVTVGIGVEYKIGDFIPFVEFYDCVHADSVLGIANSPSKISLGARITPISNKSLAILLGADVGISRPAVVAGVPYNPPYQVLGQVSYTVGLTSTERKHYVTSKDVHIVDRKFIIKKNINFKVASHELEPSSASLLDQIATVIQENKVPKLLIVGHTDSSHTEDYNLKLSIERAESVKRYLVSKGIAKDSLMTQGYGKRKPIASNLTEAGRSINRRVEFYIID